MKRLRDPLQRFVEERLKRFEAAGLTRNLREFGSVSIRTTVNGNECLSFATNNYLGLANSALLRRAASSAARQYGSGCASSRLVAGTLDLHTRLEKAAARLKRRESACVFPCGYMANVGTISALLTRDDAIVSDGSNHASIIDGCRLSGAKIFVYPHCDVRSLEAFLRRVCRKFAKVLVVTESIFSVGGTIAPLDEIVNVAKKYGAITMLDDAHATGVLGAHGRGGEELFNIEGSFDVIMGAFGKALGSQGGFIAGKKSIVNYLTNTARTFIYTTALAPPAAAAALAAIDALEKEPQRRARLHANIHHLGTLLVERGLAEEFPRTPIVPVAVGGERRSMEIQRRLLRQGIFVPAMRYPTVPKGKAMLRVSLSCLHSFVEIERLVDALEEEVKSAR
jgi:8-amino-7-oxononanoate synthase